MSRPGLFPLSLALAASLGATTVAIGVADDPARTRHEFARAIGDVTEGMPEAKVLALLGRPEDVKTENDPGGISTTGTKEIWRYGTSGHLTTATLGQVYIDKDGRVQYVFGKGTPPPAGMFEERDLRALLDALGGVPSYNAAWNYNPRKLIRAVNLLQPLGKEKALAAIDEFLRVSSHWHDKGRDGVFLVLRTLFEVPDDTGHMPPMMVGAPIPSEPKDRKLLPRFPIAIEGDIPFLLAEGFNLSGMAEEPESHVAYFREKGRLRGKPLMPSNEPFKALDTFAKSPRWIFTGEGGLGGDERGRQFLGVQALRLLDTVYHAEPDEDGDLLPWGARSAARRKAIVGEASEPKIRWHTDAQRFTFLDGTSLPEPEVKHYRREIWRPMVTGLDVELIMERKGPRSVSVWVVENYDTTKPSPVAVFTVLNVNAQDGTLAEFKTGGGKLDGHPNTQVETSIGSKGTRSSGKGFQLAERTEVRVKLVVDGKSQLSPVWKP
jgi:hypothetical protein